MNEVAPPSAARPKMNSQPIAPSRPQLHKEGTGILKAGVLRGWTLAKFGILVRIHVSRFEIEPIHTGALSCTDMAGKNKHK